MCDEKDFDGFMLNDSNSHDMVSDLTRAPRGRDSHEVMASIDTEGDIPNHIIADITEDGAWICASMSDSIVLQEWV